MEAILEARNVTAGYGPNPIVKGVSIAGSPSTISVIVGPNGAGKSTLLKAMFGMLSIHSGEVRLKGENVTRLVPERLVSLGMAYVPQNRNVFPSLSVRENLEIGGYQKISGTKDSMERVYTMFPDLKTAARRAAGTLSGGQRNMLAVGRALMSNPDVLLLDEPTAGLSPAYTKVVWDHIIRVAQAGKCVVVVEQNTTTALTSAHWGYVLVAGENRDQGPGPELLAKPDIGKMFLGR